MHVTGEADAPLSCCSSTEMARRLQSLPQGIGLPADRVGAVPEQKVSDFQLCLWTRKATAEK